MEHVKTLMSLPQTPKPCEYFDLICGSGLGGVSALMLGRLQMVGRYFLSPYGFFETSLSEM